VGPRATNYPPELRERGVRMVAEVRPDYPSDWPTICAVASRLGVGSAETLPKWVRQAGQRSDGASAQMRVANGDHERPDSTAKEMSVTEPSPSCPQSGGHAAAAGPANSVSRSLASASETRVSKSWRTTPNAKPDSSSEPRARRTSYPALAGRSHAGPSSEVLPIPAPPSTTRAPPDSTTAVTAASSPSRSTSPTPITLISWPSEGLQIPRRELSPQARWTFRTIWMAGLPWALRRAPYDPRSRLPRLPGAPTAVRGRLEEAGVVLPTSVCSLAALL